MLIAPVKRHKMMAVVCTLFLGCGSLAAGCSGENGTLPGAVDELPAESPPDSAREEAVVSDSDVARCAPASWANAGAVRVPEVAPVLEGAGKTGKPFEQSAGLDEYDYTMNEFVFSGQAPAYKSRMVVRKPRDPAKFSGTVFVEWYNVSGGIDFAVLWASSREYFMREGHAFIGVSAQAVGVNALRTQDPGRYESLQHPGDAAANTIFSQAGAAIRAHSATLLGPCMPVRALIGAGQSQSSMRLATYVNSTHPIDKVYDGYLLHSGREPASNNPGVPVFVVLTMNEGNGVLTDGPNLVKWVVAGATHNDRRITTRGAEVGERTAGGPTFECVSPVNNYPAYRVYNAALDGLHK